MHWEGEGLDTVLWSPDSWCSAGGSREPQAGLPLFTPSSIMFITACPAAELLPLLIPTFPTGQATHAVLPPSQTKPDSHFTVTTEPGTGAR